MAAGDAKPRRTDERQVLESPLSATWRPAIRERAVLVGVGRGMAEEDLDELAALADSAGADPVARIVQSRAEPDPGTYVGKGKLGELHDVIHANRADAVILDQELTPGQLRSLEERLGVKVIDRTALILDIFALHARSREGKVQVELAQLNYLLPRLRGWGEAMSRLGGGIGTRGPGETKMEVDRQHIRRRISKLRRDIRDMGRTRDVKRARRRNNQVTQIAIAGYTNAGKSTLLNRLTGAHALVADQLFATLDPTTRKLELPGGRRATLSDTVGFVSKLPARSGRGVPLHARGGDGGRRDPARRRRGLAGPGRADRGRAPGARRDRSGRHPGGARPQQDRPGRGLGAGASGSSLPGLGGGVRRSPARAPRGCSRSSVRPCRTRRSR